MGKKFLTRLGVLAAASATILTVTPLAANAAPWPSPTPNNGVKPYTVQSLGAQRIAGLNRSEVSVNAAKVAIHDNRADGKTFVLASGYVWPDAVSAATLSGQYGAKAPVLLVQQNKLGADVAEYLAGFKGTTTRVFISGGPATISDAVVAQVKSILGDNVKVSRNAGADRAQVSYNNAAETVGYRLWGASYNGSFLGNGTFRSGNAILFWHDKLQYDTEKEASYQAAKDAFDKAYAAQGAAQDAYDAATAKVDALTKQISEQVAKLQQVPEASQAAFDAAYKAVLDSSAKLQAFQDAADFLNTLGTRTTSTGELPSNLGEYRTLLNANDNAKLTAVQGLIGATDSTTLNAALGLANTKIDAQKADLLVKQDALAKATKALQDAAAAQAANAPIIKAIGQLQTQKTAALKDQDAAADALNKANVALLEAKLKLAVATIARPKAGWEARDAAALNAARDAAVKAAGKSANGSNAFLATGSVYTDALSVGPAAANNNGVVLLTNGSKLGPSAARWKANYGHANGQYVAVGGEAITAAGHDATYTVPGKDRYDVSVNIAKKFFAGKIYASVASGEIASDATSAGSFSASYNNPLVLTQNTKLPYVVDNFLRNTNQTVQPSAAVVFGGPATINAATFTAISSAIAAK